ncbi:SMI1/KNR4 family protein [Streptomyces albogriseolus]|uniref:SMI1/KNR4 family protein n=1 Tax=Streptomyces albogriseolus TaxID=1887 RepID=UPI0036833946
MGTFEELKNLLGEPRFLWSDPTPWTELEDELGVRFPEDFRTFSDAYGPVLINNQVDIGHPAAALGNLGRTIRRTIEAWSGAPDDEVPYPVGSAPGELLPWGGASSGETIFFHVPEEGNQQWVIGVYEHDEGTYREYAMTFNEWMLSYLRGQDMTVCSRNFAPQGPFFTPIS